MAQASSPLLDQPTRNKASVLSNNSGAIQQHGFAPAMAAASAAGRGGLSSERPFMLSDLTRSLQMTETETETEIEAETETDNSEFTLSASSAPNYTAVDGAYYYFKTESGPPRTSVTSQHSDWYQQVHPHHNHHRHHHHHASSDWSSSPPLKVKQEPVYDEKTEDNEPDPKKRKRNKPTLSCKECVDKKLKASVFLSLSLSLSLSLFLGSLYTRIFSVIACYVM